MCYLKINPQLEGLNLPFGITTYLDAREYFLIENTKQNSVEKLNITFSILILTGPALAYLALSTYFESKRNNLCAEVIVKSCIFRTGVVLFGRKFFLVKNIISLLEAEIVLMAKSGVYN